MRLTCTGCGAHGSIEQFTADSDARHFAELVAELPSGIGKSAIRYIALFRPYKRGLSWDRACKLMDELARMIEAGSVERQGKTIPAPEESFAKAMHQMLDKREALELPLTSHGYLVSIVAGDAPRAAAAAETAAEEQRRTASSQRTTNGSSAAQELSSEIASRVRLRMPEMTEAEKAEFLAKFQGSQR